MATQGTSDVGPGFDVMRSFITVDPMMDSASQKFVNCCNSICLLLTREPDDTFTDIVPLDPQPIEEMPWIRDPAMAANSAPASSLPVRSCLNCRFLFFQGSEAISDLRALL